MDSKLILTIFIALMLSGSAFAASWTNSTGHASFQAGLNKSMYVPGERITVSGWGSGGVCSNGMQYLAMYAGGRTLFGYFDVGYRGSGSGSTSFTAGTSDGSIKVTGCGWGSSDHDSSNFKVLCSSVNLYYTVNSPPSVDSITMERAFYSSISKAFTQNHFEDFDDVVCEVSVSDPEGDSMNLTTNLCYSAQGGTETCVDSESRSVSPGTHEFTFNLGNKIPVASRVYCTASAVGSGHSARTRSSYGTVTNESWDSSSVVSVIADTVDTFNRNWSRFFDDD